MELPAIDSGPIIPAGETKKCVILNVFSPSLFWFKLIDENTHQNQEELNKVLNDTYYPFIQNGYVVNPEEASSILVSLMHLFLPELEGPDGIKQAGLDYIREQGGYAVVYCPNQNNFFRAKAFLDTIKDGTIRVYLIDEGLHIRTFVHLLWPMSRKLTEFPPLALPGYLVGVGPYGYVKYRDQKPEPFWRRHILERLKYLVGRNNRKVWNIKFSEKSENFEGNIYAVTLIGKHYNINVTMRNFAAYTVPTHVY